MLRSLIALLLRDLRHAALDQRARLETAHYLIVEHGRILEARPRAARVQIPLPLVVKGQV